MTNTKLKEVLTPIWEDRIKRETGLYVSFQLSDQNPLKEWALDSEHIYSQICWQVSLVLEGALDAAKEIPGATAEDVVMTLAEIASEEHSRFLIPRPVEEAQQKIDAFNAAQA